MTPRLLITTGGLLAALGVAAGAIGAHLLEDKLDPKQMDMSEEARKAMLKLCVLVSFSGNLRITMINLAREMHTATSRFRCTSYRSEMMECVKSANAIKI